MTFNKRGIYGEKKFIPSTPIPSDNLTYRKNLIRKTEEFNI